MQDISQILLDIRDVGENILSTGKDIQLLLREAKKQQIKHSRDLVENILSLCTYLGGLSIKDLDRWEEISDEVRKIEFASVGLRSALKEEYFQHKIKEVFDMLRVLEISSNRIITLSFVSKLGTLKKYSYNDEDVCYSNKRSCERSCDGVCYEDSLISSRTCTESDDRDIDDLKSLSSERLDNEEVCYKDKYSCEKDCNGECYDDNTNSEDDHSCPAQDLNTKGSFVSENVNDQEAHFNDITYCDGPSDHDDTSCPEYTEHFTESPLTHVESGVYEHIGYHGSENSEKKIIQHMGEISEEDLDLGTAIRDNLVRFDNFLEESDLLNDEQNNSLDLKDEQTLDFRESLLSTETDYSQQGITYVTNINEIGDGNDDSNVPRDTENGSEPSHSDFNRDSIMSEEIVQSVEDTVESSTIPNNDLETEQIDELNSYATLPPEPTTNTFYDSGETTTGESETTTEYSYYSPTSEDSTTVGYETTTDSYMYTTEEPTTPSYETTTQDLYKLSQDVYSMASDLSSKANEISSMSSDISSKVSSMGSMVSDLNTYDNDELTKTINGVNKLTQEISSKTSEMSSGCSTMSSLASDISSASSDLSSSERRHPIKTTPWQKINSKGQDLVTAAQGVVSAAQEVLSKVGGVVELARGLRVADAVEAAGYEVTSKAQLVISETLGIASAVLELMTALER